MTFQSLNTDTEYAFRIIHSESIQWALNRRFSIVNLQKECQRLPVRRGINGGVNTVRKKRCLCCKSPTAGCRWNFVMLSHGNKSHCLSSVCRRNLAPNSSPKDSAFWPLPAPNPISHSHSHCRSPSRSPNGGGACGMNISEIIWRATKSHQNIAYVRAEPASLFPCVRESFCVGIFPFFCCVCVCVLEAVLGVAKLPSWE